MNNPTKNTIENISAKIHDMWMCWAQNIIKTEKHISEERKARWTQECFKPYEELSKNMKQLDRNFAIQIVSIIQRTNE